MKPNQALSLWQPWASLMVERLMPDQDPLKSIETRSWQRGAIGLTAIHAAKYRGSKIGDIYETEPVARALKMLGYKPDGSDLPYGAIIGHVNFDKVERTEKLLDLIDDIECSLGNYEPGRWGWCTVPADTVKYPEPIPWRGMQGIFPINGAQLRSIE